MSPIFPRLSDESVTPGEVPLTHRLRELPKAVLLTAGYYASRMPVINGVLRRPM
jgi:hypothetical protein